MDITLGKAVLEIFGKLLPKPRKPHIGDGQKRAAVRLAEHRQHQHNRVAPALPMFAEQRAAMARKRGKRWQKHHPELSLTEAPGHIKAMTRERRA